MHARVQITDYGVLALRMHTQPRQPWHTCWPRGGTFFLQHAKPDRSFTPLRPLSVAMRSTGVADKNTDTLWAQVVLMRVHTSQSSEHGGNESHANATGVHAEFQISGWHTIGSVPIAVGVCEVLVTWQQTRSYIHNFQATTNPWPVPQFVTGNQSTYMKSKSVQWATANLSVPYPGTIQPVVDALLAQQQGCLDGVAVSGMCVVSFDDQLTQPVYIETDQLCIS